MAKDELNFAYDDAFRTMAVECDDLLISLINHMLGENYDSSARIVRNGNEHFIEDPQGDEKRRITDSLIGVEVGSVLRKYHIECESSPYDGSILVRMFEYDAQIALDTGTGDRQRLRLSFPRSGLLELRSSESKPREAIIEISTPGGTVEYPVKILYESDYTMDQLLKERLYFLIPFYIFNYEKKLKEIDGDEARLKELRKTYEDAFQKLLEAQENGSLSAFSKGVIMMLTRRVLLKLAGKRKNIKEKVGGIMGGKVMDLDIIRIKHEADAKIAENEKKLAESEKQLAKSEEEKGKMSSKIARLEQEIKKLKASAGML